MKLTTKIVYKDTGKEFFAFGEWSSKTVSNCAGDSQANIYVSENEEGNNRFQVGVIVYTRKGDVIHLEWIHNQQGSSYKYVGTAAIEYLLRLQGINRIIADASYSSHTFYYKLGFRIPPEKAKQVPGILEGLEWSYSSYQSAKNRKQQLAAYTKICRDEQFGFAVSSANYIAQKWDEVMRREGKVPSLAELALTKIRKEDVFDAGNPKLDRKGAFEAVIDMGLFQDRNKSIAFRIHTAIDLHALWTDYARYCAAKQPEEKAKLCQSIVNNRCFNEILEYAKNEVGEDRDLDPQQDFEIIMRACKKRSDYRKFIDKLNGRLEDDEECEYDHHVDTSNMGAILVELSPTVIKELKIKFQIPEPQAAVSASATSSRQRLDASSASLLASDDPYMQALLPLDESTQRQSAVDGTQDDDFPAPAVRSGR